MGVGMCLHAWAGPFPSSTRTMFPTYSQVLPSGTLAAKMEPLRSGAPAWKFKELISIEVMWTRKDRGRTLEYPKITLKTCTDGVELRVHEPIIWRIRDMVSRP